MLVKPQLAHGTQNGGDRGETSETPKSLAEKGAATKKYENEGGSVERVVEEKL